nr:hypothetical protein BaRGS_009932 [Batillaria attramentaria]
MSDSDNGAVGVGDQNRHDNTNYENTPWLEGRLASPDSPTRQAGRTTDSCIYEPVGNEDVLGNAQHQRDSGYQSFTKFDLGKEREISENAHPYQNYNFGQRKPPVFSQFWQFSEQFTAVGGSLQGKWSDVRLQIPEDALSGAEVETIRGAVCTNLSKVHSDLHLPVNEYIVSPVIEYAADSNKKFHTKKPMRISLPHFMHSSFRRSSVKVYRFNRNYKGDIGFHELRLEDQDAVQQKATPKYLRKMAGVCYFDENNQIQILTDHFSGYLCTYCEKEHPLSEFHLEVYAKIEQIGRQTLGMVSSYIWDRRYTIKDFQQNRFDEDTANNAKMKKIDCVMLSALSKDDDLSRIVLVTELGFTSKKDALWELTATRKIAQDECFRCLINVGYVSASDFKDDGRLCFMDDPEHQTIVVTLEIHPSGLGL